jgi:alkanesulfonate monooxygenase SsuD/methylene tetrahydromethanopterin reductase-like flavin-dependent oxidoreductase (luciferase family)
VKIGSFLSSEDYSPAQLIAQAKMAEQAGFDALWISDHFHPWNEEQGQGSFVWSVLGAVSEVTSLPVTTAVTCPTTRIHPAIIAQAAATVQCLMQGRFRLGVGTGVAVIRKLWTGESIDHRGPHYIVEDARIYTLPQAPPPIYISGFGSRSAALAGEIGDGFICTKPDRELLQAFRDHGGAGKPTQAGYKVCWSNDEETAVKTAHRLWANAGLPGELAQILPSPRHFEQASQLVTEDMTRKSAACGNGIERHLASFRPYAEAGYDEIYLAQMGGAEQATRAEGFFEFYGGGVLDRLRALA